jgi:indole-3-glycerol phosphate synthase
MTGTLLDKIIERKRERVAEACLAIPLEDKVDWAKRIRPALPKHAFRQVLARTDRPNIIAEFKRSSPSKGIIDQIAEVGDVAIQYERSGAVAMSVLTEEDFFNGSLNDLDVVKTTIALPVLRKDFTISDYQVYESAAAGADAILLIVAALSEDELRRFRSLAEDELGMDAVVEVHSIQELEIAVSIGASIIGVNNRNLKTFEVSLDVSRELITKRPADVLMVAESGLSSRAEIDELRKLGFDGFLIGEALMRQPQVLASLAGGAA